MQELEAMTLEEMREFVRSNRKLRFEAEDREGLYGLVERVLKNQRYSKLRKNERGVVRRFLIRVSGLSRAQMTRLIWTVGEETAGTWEAAGTAPLSHALYGGRYCLVEPCGSRTRRVIRTGGVPDPVARAQRLRPERI